MSDPYERFESGEGKSPLSDFRLLRNLLEGSVNQGEITEEQLEETMAIMEGVRAGIAPEEVIAMYGSIAEVERRAGSYAVTGLETAIKYGKPDN